MFTRRCWRRTTASQAPAPPPPPRGRSLRGAVAQVAGSFPSMTRDRQSCPPPPPLHRAGDHRCRDQNLKVRDSTKCVCPGFHQKMKFFVSCSSTQARPSAATGRGGEAAFTGSGQTAPPSPTLQTSSGRPQRRADSARTRRRHRLPHLRPVPDREVRAVSSSVGHCRGDVARE